MTWFFRIIVLALLVTLIGTGTLTFTVFSACVFWIVLLTGFTVGISFLRH